MPMEITLKIKIHQLLNSSLSLNGIEIFERFQSTILRLEDLNILACVKIKETSWRWRFFHKVVSHTSKPRLNGGFSIQGNLLKYCN